MPLDIYMSVGGGPAHNVGSIGQPNELPAFLRQLADACEELDLEVHGVGVESPQPPAEG